MANRDSTGEEEEEGSTSFHAERAAVIPSRLGDSPNFRMTFRTKSARSCQGNDVQT